MFSFLSSSKGEAQNDKLNPVLAGYFKRIFNVLLNHSPALLFDFVYSDLDAISLLITHMYQDSICEVLIKVINFSNNSFSQEQDFTKNVNKIDADGEAGEAAFKVEIPSSASRRNRTTGIFNKQQLTKALALRRQTLLQILDRMSSSFDDLPETQ